MRVNGSAGSGVVPGLLPQCWEDSNRVFCSVRRNQATFFLKKNKEEQKEMGVGDTAESPPRDHPGTLQTTFRYSVYIWHRDRSIHPHTLGLWTTGWLFTTCVCDWERPLVPGPSLLPRDLWPWHTAIFHRQDLHLSSVSSLNFYWRNNKRYFE